MTRKLLTAARKKKQVPKWLIAILILLLLYLPFMLLQLIKTQNEYFNMGTKNRENVLNPPTKLEKVSLFGSDGLPLSLPTIYNRWGLVYITPTVCETNCVSNITKMLQIKQKISKQYPAFYLMVITTPEEAKTNAMYAFLRSYLPKIYYVTATQKQFKRLFELLPKGTQNSHLEILYTIDPQSELVISYPTTEAGKAILQNLNKVMKL